MIQSVSQVCNADCVTVLPQQQIKGTQNDRNIFKTLTLRRAVLKSQGRHLKHNVIFYVPRIMHINMIIQLENM